ncbi:MAG: hypothetical protein ACI9VL_001414, partial [Colwellia sp.]
GQHNMEIVIDSGDINIPTSSSFIRAEAIAESSSINTQLSNGSAKLLWFSGGQQPWLIDKAEAAIISGDIEDDQQSAVLLTFTGAGSLSFDWSVSSEENIDNPDEPFDALYLFVDGEQINFISGDVAYTKVTIDDLAAGDHQVTWLYKKDGGASEGKDEGYLKDVIFTPIAIPTAPTPAPSPTPVPTPTPAPTQTSSNSSGGSVYFILFILTLLTLNRRRI